VPGDYYPAALRDAIDPVNARIYGTLNNGVYKSGFARSQEAYEKAVLPLFDTLDWMEDILSRQRWLAGNQFTEADIRAFPTLIRFDPVYHGHFKCNRARIVDYPNLWSYTREIYQMPGVAETVNLEHIRNHYYASHETVNPTRIVAIGPQLDYMEPHGRG
jgi:putative glutathione S-transferase